MAARQEHHARPEPDYFGTKPFLDEVEFTIETIEDEYKNFQAGQRDYARIPSELIAQAKATYERQGSFITEANRRRLPTVLVRNRR